MLLSIQAPLSLLIGDQRKKTKNKIEAARLGLLINRPGVAGAVLQTPS